MERRVGRRRTDARRRTLDRPRDRADVVRGRAAAAAENVDEPAGRELVQEARGLIGELVVLAERVGQAGVRIAGHVAGGDAGELGEIRPNLARPEGTVQADAERPGVLHRDVERVERLARERAAAAVGDRHRNHQRQADAAGRERGIDPDQRRFRVERVEDRLEQQDVGAAVDQSERLLGVGVAHGVEGRRAERRVVDVGRDRERAIGRAHRAGDESRAVGRPRRPLVDHAAGDARALDVDFVGQRFEAVVGLRDRGGGERVGLDDVGAGLQILPVDGGDIVGPRQHQQIAVALEVGAVRLEAVAAKGVVAQLQPLNHRAHRAVEDEDALGEQLVKGGFGGCGHAILNPMNG